MGSIICLLVGASGSGKTTVANILHEKYGLTQIESYTTRPPRTKDEFGHVFIDDQTFDTLSEIVAYTEYSGFRYCATRQQVDEHDVYVIDPAGVSYFMERYHGEKRPVVCFLDVSREERKRRMLARGDSPAAVEERLRNDDVAFENIPFDMLDWLFQEYDDPSELADDIYREVFINGRTDSLECDDIR